MHRIAKGAVGRGRCESSNPVELLLILARLSATTGFACDLTQDLCSRVSRLLASPQIDLIVEEDVFQRRERPRRRAALLIRVSMSKVSSTLGCA
jgi:hypothetical protein